LPSQKCPARHWLLLSVFRLLLVHSLSLPGFAFPCCPYISLLVCAFTRSQPVRRPAGAPPADERSHQTETTLSVRRAGVFRDRRGPVRTIAGLRRCDSASARKEGAGDFGHERREGLRIRGRGRGAGVLQRKWNLSAWRASVHRHQMPGSTVTHRCVPPMRARQHGVELDHLPLDLHKQRLLEAA